MLDKLATSTSISPVGVQGLSILPPAELLGGRLALFIKHVADSRRRRTGR